MTSFDWWLGMAPELKEFQINVPRDQEQLFERLLGFTQGWFGAKKFASDGRVKPLHQNHVSP